MIHLITRNIGLNQLYRELNQTFFESWFKHRKISGFGVCFSFSVVLIKRNSKLSNAKSVEIRSRLYWICLAIERSRNRDRGRKEEATRCRAKTMSVVGRENNCHMTRLAVPLGAKWPVIFPFVMSWSFVTSCDRLETNVTDFLFFNAKWPVSKNFRDHDPSNAYIVVKWPVISWRVTNFVIQILNCFQIIYLFY